ncbi:hypothetical protein [Streptomyces sp. NPDC012616]|uniref:hypothetical protein n=1 Tax=Streptomyces sp. NPDC012616 TaxID=3364840 RepID=UPI0036E8FD6D
MQYEAPADLRAFLRLCLDPGPGRDKRTPVRLVEILPPPLHDELLRHAPHLRPMRHRADALAEQQRAARQEYADALAAWIHGEEPKPAPDTEERYVIGRDGVFATLYDQQEHRPVVENATEEHCRQVRDELLAIEDRPCVKCSAPFASHIAWAAGHLYVDPGEPKQQPAPARRRSRPLMEAAAAAYDAVVSHAATCGTCWPGMRLEEMCGDGQRAAVAALDVPTDCTHDGSDDFRTAAGQVIRARCPDCGERLAPECAHLAWEVLSEYRNARQLWVKSRKCGDCGEHLDPLVDPEPHWPDKAVEACPGFEKAYQGESDAKRRLAPCRYCRQPKSAH